MGVLEVQFDIARPERADRQRRKKRPTPSPWKMSKTRCTVLYRESA
jgi:hypothetical protein